MFGIASLLLAALVVVGIDAQLPSDCGRSYVQQNLEERIVGGSEARPYSWPWQISLRVYGGHTCGASIISKDYVVTAAHCTEGQSASAFTLHAGRHYETGTEPYEQVKYVNRMWQHEYYNPNTIDNDITLFRVSSPFTFNSYVQPVCLPKSEVTASGTQMWATGWGETQGTGSQGRLKQAMLSFVDRYTCQRNYYGSGITQTMICAGKNPGDNVCMGDSGGPLVSKRSDGRWELNGASSWVGNSNCYYGGPGVFVNVYYFDSWIRNKLSQVVAEEEVMSQRGFRPMPAGVAFRTMRGKITGQDAEEEFPDHVYDKVPVQE